MKKTIFLPLVVLFCGTLCAQSPPFAWAKSIGGNGEDKVLGVTADVNGNFYMVGSFSQEVDFDPGPDSFSITSGGYDDAYVAKYNSSGYLLWVKSYGGDFYDTASGIGLDQAGNIYITGTFVNNVDFDPGAGEFYLSGYGDLGATDIYMLKLDPSGNFIFAKQFGGDYPDFPRDLEVDNEGNVYVIGSFWSTASFGTIDGVEQNVISNGNTDVFMCKMNSDGNLIWVRSFGGEGSDSDDMSSIAADSQGNVFGTGYYLYSVDFDPGIGTNIISNSGDNVNPEIFIEKLDSEGNFVWAISIGSNESDSGNSIEIDLNDNILITGNFQSSVDFDPGPGIFTLSSSPGYTPCTVKFDNDGTFLWAAGIIGGTWAGTALDVITDESGDVYTTGFFGGTKDFDPGEEVYNLTSQGIVDVYISKLTSDGNFVWAKAIGGYSVEGGSKILVDSYYNVFTFGVFDATGNYNSDEGPPFGLSNSGGSDIFIHKMGSNTIAINESSDNSKLSFIYPNPTSGILHLLMHSSEELIRIEILNTIGQVCYSKQLNHIRGNIDVDVSSLPQGIYYLKLYTKSNRQMVTDFVKE